VPLGRRVIFEEFGPGVICGDDHIALAGVEALTEILEELFPGEVLGEEVADIATCEHAWQ